MKNLFKIIAMTGAALSFSAVWGVELYYRAGESVTLKKCDGAEECVTVYSEGEIPARPARCRL